MKIAGLVVVLVAGGCAVPSKGAVESTGRDMAGGGVGGNGVGDMSGGGNGGSGGTGGSGGAGGSGGVGGSGGTGGAGGSSDMMMSLAPPDMTHLVDMPIIHDMAMSKVTPPVAGAPCSEFPQCGCAGTQNCDIFIPTTGQPNGNTVCVASGMTPLYNNCTGEGQCAKGDSCVGGVCKPFCGATSDCPGAGRACSSVVDGNNMAIPGAKICSQNCNPLNPQDATGGWSPCGPNVDCGGGTQAAPQSDCYGPAVAANTQGAACDNANCAPGYDCIGNTLSGYFCRHYCRVGNNGDCPSGTTCNTLSTPEYVGTQQYGYCN